MQLLNHADGGDFHYGAHRSGGVSYLHDDNFDGGVYKLNHYDGIYCNDDGTIGPHDEYPMRY